MSQLSLERISKTFRGVEVLRDIHLQAEPGEFICLLGPSGSGKSTILRMVGGFETADLGTISLAGEEIGDLPPNRRNIGFVFQDYALFPHLTVEENIAFGLKCKRTAAEESKARIRSVLDIVGLTGLEKRYPKQLSGGQQQRVAIARAIALRPALLLLDEPLSNLDAKLRRQIRLEMRALQQELGITTIMVTHDQEEAMTMADRIAVLQNGVIQQIGTPLELYKSPANLFVAGFIGDPPINLYPCRSKRSGGAVGISVLDTFLEISCGTGVPPEDCDYVLGIRPEDVLLSPVDEGRGGIAATVDVVEYLGSAALVHIRTAGSGTKLCALVHSKWIPGSGDRVKLQLVVENALLFHGDTTGAVTAIEIKDSAAAYAARSGS
ncbi:ABC transporter ATP-binding protein [Paenibacillus oenotherae]|uniref:ABC transporter ATP-binding protein n=1 Tax=Paenibacillus oenotherae TaxID=1435645 RepID=A0ABS7D7K6_9BACL|nr:ABC transporter ATP-binding protein [Paenibacillus oenotherae]MBW7475826.1 ABC transporter ATP-binding protein [Paenibacillus oenotherae]